MKTAPFPRYSQPVLGTLLAVAVMFLSMPAIAKPKPKPKPNRPVVETVTDQAIADGTDGAYWQGLLDDVVDDYPDDVPSQLVRYLRDDFNFRDSLLGLFRGQSGDRQTITDILLSILLGQDDSEHYPDGEMDDRDYHSEVIRYDYVINRNCLPPGQRQRLDSGKPVPPGILKKCGSIISVDD